jgi:hypothetical protein
MSEARLGLRLSPTEWHRRRRWWRMRDRGRLRIYLLLRHRHRAPILFSATGRRSSTLAPGSAK